MNSEATMSDNVANCEPAGRLNRTWWLLLFCVIAAIAADCVSTIHFMTKVGHHDEIHPAIRLAAGWFGPFFGPVVGFVGKVTAYVGLTMTYPKWAPVLSTLCVVIFLAAAVWNVHSVAGL